MPPVSRRNPPATNNRPSRRGCSRGPCFGGVSMSRPKGGASWRSIASLRSRRRPSFIGQILEDAIGRDAVIALAQHGKQIRDDEQGGGSRKQEAADNGPRQRRILLLAWATDR